MDLHQLVAELGEVIAERDRRDVRYRALVAPDVPPVRTDRTKLRMIVKNLLENALKFTPQGEVVLEVRHAEDGVEIAVTDTGIGIPERERSRVFEPFYQVEDSTHSSGGVGLGLYLVRRLSEMLGGRIELESEVGKGSTFRLWLPVGPEGRRPSAAA